MSDNPPRVVLDASAALAWLFNERGATTVSRLLSSAVLPASALVESLHRARGRGHQMRIPELHGALLEMGVRVEPFLEQDADRAARLIHDSRDDARRRQSDQTLSLGDGLCIAVAERLHLPIVGGDELWEIVAMQVKYFPFR